MADLAASVSLRARSVAAAKRFSLRIADVVDRRRSKLPVRWRPDPSLGKWELSSFRPRLQEAHEPYVRYLVAALRDRSEGGPRNIALSAGYGLGKSSVMRGVVRAFPGRVVHVTLGSLKRGVGASKGEPNPLESDDEVRSIQQEVVKQLLYSAKQAALPRSRFRRLDRFRLRAVLPIAIPIVGFLLLLVYNNDLAARIEQQIESWAVPVWVAYLVAWIVFTIALAVVVAGLSVVVRIGKVTAGSSSIELTGDDKGSDYFDRYLDEIVYFFQNTRRDIVVFEDIDRFGNAEVFEELRELNTLLNQAGQIGRKPVRFVYSVRDSLFDEWPSDSDGSLPLSLRRATQRMKFFDLVVPMLPTISHRTARDVLKRFRETYPNETLSDELVQEVARHVPDMRVLTGILNEFKVFRSLTTGPNQPELDPNESFAVLVYKVHESADFELVQFNESKLDKIFEQGEAIIQARATEVATALRRWDERAEGLVTEEQFAQAANRRLMGAIGDQLSYSNVLAPHSWFLDSVAQPAGAPTTAAFWRTLLEGRTSVVQIASSSTGSQWTVPAEELMKYARVSTETWGDAAIREARQRRDALLQEQRIFARATWAELYQRADLTHEGESFADKVQASFGDPIVPRLIELGHLTDGFYLHASVFYGQYLGNRATTFLHKYVNRRQVAMDFMLDEPDDVFALLALLGDGFLREQDAALNISLVDVVIDSDRASPFFNRYQAPSDIEIEFARAYLRAGQHTAGFLKGIAPIWPGAIDFAVQPAPDSSTTAATRVADVLSAVDSALSYRVGADQLEALRTEIQRLPLLRENLDSLGAERIASVLDTVGIEIDDLVLVTDNLQVAVRDTGRFALTYENLTHLGGGTIALDSFVGHETVLQRIEDGIDEYLRIINAYSSVSVAETANFEAMVVRFEAIDAAALEELGKRAATGSRLLALDNLAPRAWGPIIRARRVAATMKVVEDYLDAFGEDETLLNFLANSEALDPADAAQAARRVFAFKLIAADKVPVDVRARLLKSLRLDKYLAIDGIEIDDDMLPGALVDADIINDNEASLLWAQSAGFGAFRSILRASGGFADHIPGVRLSSEELEKFFDEELGIPENVRAAVHANIATFEPYMSSTAWHLYAGWAARTDATVPDAMLIALPGLSASHASVLDILIASFANRTPAVIVQVLANLGGPYARLTTIAKGSETFDKSDRMAKLAELLVARGFARSWHRTLTNRVQIFRRQK